MKNTVKKGWLTKILWRGLDWLFPQKRSVAEIENMDTEALVGLLRDAPEIPVRFLPTLPENASLKAFFDYREPVMREMLWQVKYIGNSRIISLLGKVVCQRLLEYLECMGQVSDTSETIVLIPIPLSRERMKERGFNQCELLCRAICSHDMQQWTGKKAEKRASGKFEMRTDILHKIRHTETQTSKKRSERLKNLAGCFALSGPAAGKVLCDRIVILLDDVTTTGSTLSEAAQTISAATPKKIFAMAVAH